MFKWFEKHPKVKIIIILVVLPPLIFNIFFLLWDPLNVVEPQQTKVQIVGIKAPLKVNESEYFNITAKIKNMGDYDALDVRATAVNLTEGLELAKWESDTETIDIIPKNEIVSADWWFEAKQQTKPSWEPINVTLTSKNAGNDTEIIAVKVILVQGGIVLNTA